MVLQTVTSSKSTFCKTNPHARSWYVVDGKDQVLGRLSTSIAMLLMGKNKPTYTSSQDLGNFVIVVNVDKLRLTGNKVGQKHFFHHTQYPGGARLTSYQELIKEKPERMLYLSVKRMLPKNKMSSRQILRLKMYKGSTHPHAVQNPVKLEVIS
ncbi:MAG: 50S ribosomal protein L13 [Elusimicrobia bacterium RIFCSPLOWO2_02_FULL_39_32]|nr:MAG: 50S ribosomal protein L13 [Elusimicrobia bacterium RIFCSPHIGHO2_02_FULL_39_36]OGR92341.1 MAG: 50S ribosomal protein L13 [Elusimicrobia bacterium RIFCSPLOWO2_02_FULL_39_32]OGR98884.1 MAG: 50S ribosomal protein L13 [Elusimicrobia bacterium RIFCSPLOWO2_12_FULL_39_28]